MRHSFAANKPIDPAKIIDLSHSLDSETICWPTEQPFVHQFEHYGMTPEGYFYSDGRFAAPEHCGTHMDAPLHFTRNGTSVDQVPLKSVIGPAVAIDFSARAIHNANATLSVDDIKKWESAHGNLPDAAIVVACSGWSRYWPDRRRYLGTEKLGAGADLRFPGFSPDAVRYLLNHGQVAAIAIDTAGIDPGISTDFPVHRMWLGAGKVAFENVAHVDQLPPGGATIFCIPMKIRNGTGAPSRIFALLP